jgi:glucose-1-phosphate thymidylyltransferase
MTSGRNDIVAVVPVAGIGTRLRPHTHTVPKVLIHVAGKPILGHIIDSIKPLGIKHFIFVVGHMADRVGAYVSQFHKELDATYVLQEERKGLGHAIHLTRHAVGGRPILIVLGDTIFRGDLRSALGTESNKIGVKAVDDPTRFGVVEISDGAIVNMVEKPDKPPSNLAIVGIYHILRSDLMFDCIDKVMEKNIRTKGEYQLTDALMEMLKRGERMEAFEITDWLDCGKPETLLDTNKRLLDEVGETRQIEGSIVIPPVFIADSATVVSSIIGPYVSVADEATIERSVIRNSIISQNASVHSSLMDASLVGENAYVHGRTQRLNVGDSSRIECV